MQELTSRKGPPLKASAHGGSLPASGTQLPSFSHLPGGQGRGHLQRAEGRLPSEPLASMRPTLPWVLVSFPFYEAIKVKVSG